MWRDRGTAHQSLDDGEEVTHRQWIFGAKPRWHMHKRGREEVR
jgi:hypothetical protein